MDPLAERTLNIAREALDVDDTTVRGDCVRCPCGGDDDRSSALRLIGDAEAMTTTSRAGGGAPPRRSTPATAGLYRLTPGWRGRHGCGLAG